MNNTERRERFTELMTTIALLPDIEDEEYEPVFPNGTKGLSDGNLKTAIMAQAMREDDDFRGNLINALANTGFDACHKAHEAEVAPTEDDIASVVLAIHVAWASGALTPMLMLLGAMGKMLAVLDVDTPDDLPLIFRSNATVEAKASKFDPIELLDVGGIGDLMNLIEKAELDDDN